MVREEKSGNRYSASWKHKGLHSHVLPIYPVDVEIFHWMNKKISPAGGAARKIRGKDQRH